MKKAVWFYRKVNLLWGLGLILGAWFAQAQMMPAEPPNRAKEKKERLVLDSKLRSLSGKLSFDEETKKALERSKQPNVLLAAEEKPDLIYQIEVFGAKKVEPQAVLLRLKTHIGEPLNKDYVKEDALSIYDMGLFADVTVRERKTSKGAIILSYILKEIPTIFQIIFKGNTLEQNELKEAIPTLEPYQGASNFKIEESAQKIKELYVQKGYFLAEVTAEIKPTSKEDIEKREKEQEETVSKDKSKVAIDTAKIYAPDFVDVIFHIRENQKVYVERIYFQGNEHFPADEIKKHLRTQEKHILSIVSDMGTFREDFLEMDRLIIERLLNDRGFLKAKVLAARPELIPDKSRVTIGYAMIEGPQYRLGEVTFSGDLIEENEEIYKLKKRHEPDQPIFSVRELAAYVTQKEGGIFNKSLMIENVSEMSELYKDQGYAYVNIIPMPSYREEEHVVDFNIKIESGPRVTIERIDIEGNAKTMDEVIRRELRLDEGDLYSSSLLRLSELRIKRLGYFESVEFSTKQGSADNKMVLIIKVKEKNNGNFQAGAGFGTGGEGLILRAQFTQQNFLGRGQEISTTINWSEHRQFFDISFVDSHWFYLFDQPVTLAFTAYNRDMILGEFSRASTGGDFTLGYPIGGPLSPLTRKWQRNATPNWLPYVPDFEHLMFLLTYSAERVKITDSTMDVRFFGLHQNEPRYTTSLRPTLRFDQRDNMLMPRAGYYLEFRSEIALPAFGANLLSDAENHLSKGNDNDSLDAGLSYKKPAAQANAFTRFGGNLRFYHNLDSWFLLKGLVFKGNFDVGFLNTFGVPLIFENYSAGGINSIRGYYYHSIGPVQRVGSLLPFEPRRDLRVGGDKQFLASFELEFPLVRVLQVGGVAFFDMGNVYGQDDRLFYLGGKSPQAQKIRPADPLGIYKTLGLFSSVGFGVRWLSPLGYLRFEWGFPLNPRPAGTPGFARGDRAWSFEFNIGPSF